MPSPYGGITAKSGKGVLRFNGGRGIVFEAAVLRGVEVLWVEVDDEEGW